MSLSTKTVSGKEQQQFSSKDFHRTFARPEYVKPSRLVHKNVERAGAHDQFSAERKHPVFFVDLPTRNVSMTIGGLLPGQLTNRHRHTYETVLYVIEGKGWTDTFLGKGPCAVFNPVAKTNKVPGPVGGELCL